MNATTRSAAPTPTADVVHRLRHLKIVPVIVIDDPADAVPLAQALVRGGLPCAEVTFRTGAAAESIRRIAGEVPDLLVGAGTVLTPMQVEQARDAGAAFIVAPGFNPATADACAARALPFFPGVCTPTEIEAALQHELRVLKFFPAAPMGGVAYLKAIAAPYGMIEFIPTGGINAASIGEYLGFKRVVACGGSWMAPGEWISGKWFDRIATETARAVETLRVTGGEG